MNSHQHAAIERARITWHYHQFEHGCYGRDCTQDRRQYRAYQCAISGDLADDPPPLTPVGTAAVMSPAGHERARSRP